MICFCTTEHLEDGLWFRDEEDFKVGMNHVAIEAALHPEVCILAFVLMSNHVHFLLKAQESDARSFMEGFKHRYSIYVRRKYGLKNLLRHNRIDIKEIPFEDESVEKAIAYTVVNPVAAGICLHASQYPWGTGCLYFSPKPRRGGKCLKDMSLRAIKRLIHSDADHLPGHWRMGEDGYILPENYVDVKEAEAIFRRPQRLDFFLRNSSKAKKRLEAVDEKRPAFKDQSILSTLPDLCRSLFHKECFELLQPQERVEFVRQIRYRFSADAHQIARVCGITYAEAARLLDAL